MRRVRRRSARSSSRHAASSGKPRRPSRRPSRSTRGPRGRHARTRWPTRPTWPRSRAEFRSLGTSPTVDERAARRARRRLRLEPVLEKVTQRLTPVATDVRGHWAGALDLPVTQTGVMDVYPNDTFQPGSTVLRSDFLRASLAGPDDHRAQRHPSRSGGRRARCSRICRRATCTTARPRSPLGGTPLDDNKFSPRTPATGEAVTAAPPAAECPDARSHERAHAANHASASRARADFRPVHRLGSWPGAWRSSRSPASPTRSTA